MSDKRKCPAYMIYEERPFPNARVKMHIAPCTRGRKHEAKKHGNDELDLEWE